MQDSQSVDKDLINGHGLPRGDTRNVLPKNEAKDNESPSLCVLNTQAPLPILQYKRRRPNESGSNRSNGSDESTETGPNPSSSTLTTADTTMTASATRTAVSALLEFSLMEPVETGEPHPRAAPRAFQADDFDSSVPPSCGKLIKDLKKEVHKITVERETLRLEMMSAQAMINILQSKVDYLIKENDDLKRNHSRSD